MIIVSESVDKKSELDIEFFFLYILSIATIVVYSFLNTGFLSPLTFVTGYVILSLYLSSASGPVF